MHIHAEDNTAMTLFQTLDYIVEASKSVDSLNIDILILKDIEGSKQFLVLKQ